MITSLTPKEKTVLELIANEMSSSEIADRLYISTHTVISHRKNMMSKLDAKNTAGLIRKGFIYGYLQI